MKERLFNYCATATINDLPGNHVDSILINLYDDLSSDSSIARTKRMLNKANPILVIQDNGGYNLLMAEEEGKAIIHDESKPIKYKDMLNLTPHHNVKKATIIKPNLLIASDWPIRRFADPTEREEEFNQKFETNVEWAIQSAKLRQDYCPEIGLLIAIQSYSINHLHLFLKAISPIICDGFCMPTRGQSLGQTALFMVRLWQLKVRILHLLGVAALFPMALSAYMARHFFSSVSLDARSWKKRAENREYLNPHNLSGVNLSDDVTIDRSIPTDCCCFCCRNMAFTDFKDLPYYHKRILLGCHNFLVTQNMARELYNNAGTINSLINFLRSRTDRTPEIEELYNTLCLVETLKSKDIRYLEELLS